MRQRISNYVKWILPVLFILYYGNISLFIHAHIVNGVIVVHSHPFRNKADGSPHDHNNNLAEFQFYQAASSIQASDGAVATLLLEKPNVSAVDVFLLPSYDVVLQITDRVNFLRPPPAEV